LVTAAPDGTEKHYYRTSNGTEVDLLLTIPAGDLSAIEVKRTSATKIERGFHSACADLNPRGRFCVYPGTERSPFDDRTDAISVVELAKALQSVTQGPVRNSENEGTMVHKAESTFLFLLLLVVPMALIAITVKLTSKGPVLRFYASRMRPGNLISGSLDNRYVSGS